MNRNDCGPFEQAGPASDNQVSFQGGVPPARGRQKSPLCGPSDCRVGCGSPMLLRAFADPRSPHVSVRRTTAGRVAQISAARRRESLARSSRRGIAATSAYSPAESRQTGQSLPNISRVRPEGVEHDVEVGREILPLPAAARRPPSPCPTPCSRRSRAGRWHGISAPQPVDLARWRSAAWPDDRPQTAAPGSRLHEFVRRRQLLRVEQQGRRSTRAGGAARRPRTKPSPEQTADRAHPGRRAARRRTSDSSPTSRRSSPTRSLRRSTQPITPFTSGCALAKLSSQRLSSTLCRACTATEPSILLGG
jgi:hypothetical protein